MNVNGHNPQLCADQRALFSSARFDVWEFHTDTDKIMGMPSPSYVTITDTTTSAELGRSRPVSGPIIITLKGENARIFVRELKELKLTCRGKEGGNYQEWRWHKSVFHPFIFRWVARMTNVKFALDAMGVSRV